MGHGESITMLVLIILIVFGAWLCIRQGGAETRMFIEKGYCQEVVHSEDGCREKTIWVYCNKVKD